MDPADLALVLTAMACLGLRLGGVWLAGGLAAEHPAIAWATAVAQATLALARHARAKGNSHATTRDSPLSLAKPVNGLSLLVALALTCVT